MPEYTADPGDAPESNAVHDDLFEDTTDWKATALALRARVVELERLLELATIQKPKDLQPPLSFYKIKEKVEVLRNGDWIPGVITSSQAGVVNVDTERGPVGVGGPLRIRKLA